MRRPALIALAVVVLAGTLALALVGTAERRTLAFTLGVPAGSPVAPLRPGATACQAPIPASASFDAVELQVGTYERPGPPLSVDVSRPDGGDVLAAGELAGGYADVARPTIRLDRSVREGGYVAVCVTNEGRRRAALYGAGDPAARTSTAKVDGRPIASDLDLVFRMDARSTLSLVPDVLERAALFRGGWVGAWLLWLLLAAVAIGAPALLALALRASLSDADDPRRVP